MSENYPPPGDSPPAPDLGDLGHGDEPFGEPADGQVRGRSLDRAVREVIKKGIEKGIETGLGTLTRTDSAIRDLMADAKMPKELMAQVLNQVEGTKSAVVRGVAKEVREFLSATDVSAEFFRALTSVKLDVRTEVRFVPNDDGKGVQAHVGKPEFNLESTGADSDTHSGGNDRLSDPESSNDSV